MNLTVPDELSESTSHATRISPRTVAKVDSIERVIILGLYSVFVYRISISLVETFHWGNLCLLANESMLVGFVLCRRSANRISAYPLDWFLAFGSTCLPLLVVPGVQSDSPWNRVAGLMCLYGLFMQLLSKLVLGRRFGIVPAHRGLCMRGPYALVRHPIYLGYLVSHAGFLLLIPSQLNLAIYGLFYLLLIPRILAEEKLLKQDPKYQAYSDEVRYRLIPGVF
jgi:protein-S-isoprenylcysteine O-methyltransferase Ste14